MADSGELILARVSPKGYRRLGSAAILNDTVRAYPALAGGFLYVRSTGELVCVDLRKETKAK